jgi:hypothetical protein
MPDTQLGFYHCVVRESIGVCNTQLARSFALGEAEYADAVIRHHPSCKRGNVASQATSYQTGRASAHGHESGWLSM